DNGLLLVGRLNDARSQPGLREQFDGEIVTMRAGSPVGHDQRLVRDDRNGDRLARERKVTLLSGSILEQGAPGGRLYNTTVVFGPDGSRLAVYRKIHLFDVDVGDGTPYLESAAVAPGAEVVVADTEVGRLGLSICYDLRFPELYRRLSAGGATLVAVPAAFTLMTGKDHWEVLLRARAIENQCYVFAPAQGGRHSPQRVTWGHAMVVDPWGLVTARASEGEGLAVAAMDTELLARIRRNLPCLQHRRLE
ncbi:MAG: carbon-nitrogen hydrolase family protein, partial [Cystobacter sp.]